MTKNYIIVKQDKGGFFFQKLQYVFSKLQISKKKYSDSFLEYFFWRFEKRIALSEKKPLLGVSHFFLA